MDDMLAPPVFPESNAGDTANDDTSSQEDVAGEETKDSEADGSNEDGGEAPESDKAPAGNEGKKDDKPKSEDAPEDKKPNRKDKYQYIMERIRKREQKQAKDPEAGDDHSGEDEISPTDAEAMEKFFEQKYGKDMESILMNQFEAETKLFLETNELAKHANTEEKKKYKELSLDPRYSDLSEEEILMKSMGSRRLLQIGAQMEKEASKKADSSKVGGSVGKKVSDDVGSGLPDFSKMSDKEFAEYQQKIRSGL